MMTPEEKRIWNTALDRNATALRDSAIFMQLWSDGIAKDPLACMQLGLCMMQDKPIHVLLPVGSTLPENMRKVAVSVEYYDRDASDSLKDASMRIMKNAGYKDKTDEHT